MAIDDFNVNAMKVTDESHYERGDRTARYRVYTFYLGDHGPFVERVPLADFDATEIDRRVTELRRHLETLPR